MKYAVEIGSGVMIYIPSFIKIGSANQTLMGTIYRHRRQSGPISLLSLFQNKKSRLTRGIQKHKLGRISRKRKKLTYNNA
jgi:hypothetical protein